MRDKKILIIVILIVGLGLIISNYVGLFGEDYGTGLNINTTTQKFEFKGHYDGKGYKFLYTDPYHEQLDSTVYITSWQQNGKSVKISTKAKFYFRDGWNYNGWSHFPELFALGQYAWIVQYIDTNNRWHTIINGKNNWFDRDIVIIESGKLMGNLPNCYYSSGERTDNVFGDDTWTHANSFGDWRNLETGTLVFSIKGAKIGAIRAYCIIEAMELHSAWQWDWEWIGGEYLISEDWAYLASGIGRVDVLGANSIRQDGTTYTEGTNREVPLYVFEEGSTVKFSVDTGYAGAMTGEKGWRLAIYKPTETQPLATWWLDDDLRGYIISWTIPKGTWTPGGRDENRLEVYLTNTVIDQAEVTFFVVDNISKIPSPPTIETDKPKYMKGETVKLTLTAEANPITQSPIKKFYVEVRYNDPQSPDFDRFYVPAYHVSGLTYRGTTRFTAEQSGELIISASSWDEAGRYSDKVTVRDIDVEEGYGNYEITVFVNETDGTPINGAKVTIGGQTGYTSTNGKVTFWLKWGTYSITVEKAGYNTHKGKVVVNSDKTIEIILTPSILPPEGWAMYLVIAVALAVIIYIGVVVYKKYSRR